VSNSGDGSISRINESGISSTFLGGFSTPHGPYGLSFDASGNMYFVDHGSGAIYSSDLIGNTQVLGSVSSLGGTFTGIGFDNSLFVTDVNAGGIYTIDNYGMNEFASGFEGKNNSPIIGPNDFIFDGANSLYVGDGDNIWRITRAVPEPTSLVLLAIALVIVGFTNRCELIGSKP
jgi:hypothetical protein